MADKSNLEIEFRVLKTICSDTKLSSHILPKLETTHFSSKNTQVLYRRISYLLKTKGYVPSWRDLASDPGVRSDTRKALRSVKVKVAKTSQEMLSSFDVLDNHRKIRQLFQLGANLEEALSEQSIDLPSALEKLSSDLAQVVNGAGESVLTHIGLQGNALPLVKKLLTDGGPVRIPTGFQGFDKDNIGFPVGDVVLLGANTGSGKSTLISTMADNMAMAGASVGVVPLEMDAEANMQRILARVSGEDLTNLINPLEKITVERRREIYKTYMDYDDKIKRRGGKVSLVEPRFDVTMENLLEYLKPFQYDVIFIDYIGLLSGVSGDNQWQALSAAIAYAKRWAALNNCLVIGAVQVTDDGLIRYSRGMMEHAAYFWSWTFAKGQRDLGVTYVEQLKARQGRMFDFPLMFEWSNMLVRDATKNEEDTYKEMLGNKSKDEGSGKARWKSGSSKSTKGKYDDYEENMEKDKGSPNSNVKGGRKKKKEFDSSDYEF